MLEYGSTLFLAVPNRIRMMMIEGEMIVYENEDNTLFLSVPNRIRNDNCGGEVGVGRSKCMNEEKTCSIFRVY